jgi:hypothetical protein
MPFPSDSVRASSDLRRPFVTYGTTVEHLPLIRNVLVKEFPGYDVWDRTYRVSQKRGDQFTIRVATTKAGEYIGDPNNARYLVAALGIAPELRDVSKTVCTIGFSAKSGKWYGWSHRAVFGFHVGSVVKAGDVIAESIPVGTRATNLDEARWFAEKFAEAVS